MEKVREKVERRHHRRTEDDYSSAPKPTSTASPEVLEDMADMDETLEEAIREHDGLKNEVSQANQDIQSHLQRIELGRAVLYFQEVA